MRHILLVDDDPDIREVLGSVLTHEGYWVRTAATGVEAIRTIRTSQPDIVITDILMPDMTGLELIMQLRSAKPRLRVVAISGGGEVAQDACLRIAERIGAHHILTKPVMPKDLIFLLKTI